MISENVFLHGLAGAKLRLSTTGDAGLLQHFQKLPPAGIAVANDLLFRFPSLLWLRRSEGKTLKSLKTFNVFKVFASLCKNLQVFQTPDHSVLHSITLAHLLRPRRCGGWRGWELSDCSWRKQRVLSRRQSRTTSTSTSTSASATATATCIAAGSGAT